MNLNRVYSSSLQANTQILESQQSVKIPCGRTDESKCLYTDILKTVLKILVTETNKY